MEKWLPYLDRFGLMAAIVAVIGYFLIKHWWPYWKEQDAKERDERRNRESRLITMQEVSIKEMTEAIRASTHQSEKISDHIEALTEEVRTRR